FDFLNIYKTNRFTDFPILYTGRDFLDKTHTQITINVKFSVSGDFDHVSRQGFIFEYIKYTIHTVADQIIQYDHKLLLSLGRKYHKTINGLRNFHQSITHYFCWGICGRFDRIILRFHDQFYSKISSTIL